MADIQHTTEINNSRKAIFDAAEQQIKDIEDMKTELMGIISKNPTPPLTEAALQWNRQALQSVAGHLKTIAQGQKKIIKKAIQLL